MHNNYTDLLLDLLDVKTQQVLEINEHTLHIMVTPRAYIQACPTCRSDNFVIRKGSNRMRKIRHCDAFDKKIFILAPAIRMFCNHCLCGFVWQYTFVEAGKRYSKSFEKQAIRIATISTVKQSAELNHMPTSSLQFKHQQWVTIEAKLLQKHAWEDAIQSSSLVLGIDDFAIRKGHTYNTGIHNLRGETLLDILPGRKLEELREYAKRHPAFLTLRPKAVVLDLAPYYHTWIQECFPKAVRIADRFHVQRYVVEALQIVRKTVQSTLSSRAKARLKGNHRLLNPKKEYLSPEKQQELNEILSYSSLLQAVYLWKEAFGEWYDCSPNAEIADIRLESLLKQGEQIDHPAVVASLKTLRNWRKEIVNYHRCRWTNATVEGRNNRIKAFQRRHYFTRNQARYIHGLLIECNSARYRP